MSPVFPRLGWAHHFARASCEAGVWSSGRSGSLLPTPPTPPTPPHPHPPAAFWGPAESARQRSGCPEATWMRIWAPILCFPVGLALARPHSRVLGTRPGDTGLGPVGGCPCAAARPLDRCHLPQGLGVPLSTVQGRHGSAASAASLPAQPGDPAEEGGRWLVLLGLWSPACGLCSEPWGVVAEGLFDVPGHRAHGLDPAGPGAPRGVLVPLGRPALGVSVSRGVCARRRADHTVRSPGLPCGCAGSGGRRAGAVCQRVPTAFLSTRGSSTRGPVGGPGHSPRNAASHSSRDHLRPGRGADTLGRARVHPAAPSL